MPSIIDSIKADADRGLVDLRRDAPELLAALGVNQENEHAVFHAVLLYLYKAVLAGVAGEVKAVGL